MKYIHLDRDLQIKVFENSSFRIIRDPYCKNNKNTGIQFLLLKQGISLDVVYADILKNLDLELEIIIKHEAKNTKSTLISRIILEEGAKFNFCGNISIASEAGESSGVLETKALITGRNALWKTKPNLQISSKSAMATHKAIITNLNRDHLKYLENRGIYLEEGKGILKKAFLLETTTSEIEQEKILKELGL